VIGWSASSFWLKGAQGALIKTNELHVATNYFCTGSGMPFGSKLSWPAPPEQYSRRVLTRYISALSIITLAVLIRLWLDPVLGRSGFAIFLTGMLIAAWVGGVGPSLISQTLILFAQAWWFEEAPKPHAAWSVQGIVSMVAFYSVGTIVAVLSETRRAAYDRLIEQRREAVSQREQLRATFACIGDGVIVTNSSGQITLLNPQAERMMGWSLSECLGKPVNEVFITRDEQAAENVTSPLHRVFRHGEVLHETMDWLLTTRQGALLPISYSAAPIFNEKNETTGVVLIFSDQTERRQTMLELRSANRRKDEFLATLAHELRNPLAPISMGVELLKLSTDDRETFDEVIDTMERQTKHMVRLIDDLLDVSRITRGKVELRKSEVKLSQIVQDAVEATRPLMEEARHELRITFPDRHLILRADPNRVTQVLSNLLNNAAKYTPSGGLIELIVQQLNDKVAITVADNGLGIAAENQATIFDMFMQARNTLESGHKGLGIGLTLVKRLVDMHGGTVEVQSGGLGCGSRFRVLLPDVVRAENSTLPAAATVLAKVGIPKGCILIVDDNEDALKTLNLLVKSQGHEVCLAHDGVEAVVKAEQYRPDVILMDIGMPKMNGYEAARQIRMQPWGTDIVLVATTGWGQEDDVRRTREAGFDHHLVKPIDQSKLRELLTKHLSQLRVEAPRVSAKQTATTNV
jgi:PAS domain S-box-containing protein